MGIRHQEPYYIELADKVSNRVSALLEKRHHMSLIGQGGALCDQVNSLGLRFHIKGPLSKEQLRVILVDCAEVFLNTVNNDIEIRPFLKNYPFTVENIDVALFVYNPDGYPNYYPGITIASVGIGKVSYFSSTLESKQFVSEEKEPYEEALQIVRGQK